MAKNEIEFDIAEDEGIDLNKPKVAIKEDEEETPEQKEKKKGLLKKGIIIGSIVLLIAIVGLIIFIVTRPKIQERILPYSIESGSGNYTTSGEIKDDSYYVEYYTNTEEYYGIAISTCNIKDKPTSVGGNTKITAEQGDKIHILGDVYDKDDEFLNWYYCIYKGKIGYVSGESIEPFNRREDNQEGVFEESSEPETSETDETETLNKEEQEIKNKAILKEIDTGKHILEKSEKYKVESYTMRETYSNLAASGTLTWITEGSIAEDGTKIYETTDNESYNFLVILIDKFETLNTEYIETDDTKREEELEKEIDELLNQYKAVFGEFKTKEEYDMYIQSLGTITEPIVEEYIETQDNLE